MFEVGQKLWFVPSQRRMHDYEATVSKVGRVWATLSNHMRATHLAV